MHSPAPAKEYELFPAKEEVELGCTPAKLEGGIGGNGSVGAAPPAPPSAPTNEPAALL